MYVCGFFFIHIWMSTRKKMNQMQYEYICTLRYFCSDNATHTESTLCLFKYIAIYYNNNQIYVHLAVLLFTTKKFLIFLPHLYFLYSFWLQYRHYLRRSIIIFTLHYVPNIHTYAYVLCMHHIAETQCVFCGLMRLWC